MFWSTSTRIVVYVCGDGLGLYTVGLMCVSLRQGGFSLTWNSASARVGWDVRGVVLGEVG